MNTEIAKNEWAPMVRLDLKIASKAAFEETWAEFARQRDAIEPDKRPPFPFTEDGWCDVTPQMAEAALLYSAGNRPLTFNVVKAYAADMAADGWKPTGQALCASQGRLDEGHHRLMACYLGGVSFRTYVVVSVPEVESLFAYYDRGKRRTNADALSIAGWNGAGKIMAKAISDLALRYDAGALGVMKQPRFKAVSPHETLAYLAAHPDFQAAAHRMLTSYPQAVSVIGEKAAAVFFAWLVIRAYGEATLDDFCRPLGSGAKLDEDSPILALRERLRSAEEPMYTRTIAACVNKAFLMHVTGQKMPKSRGRILPLSIDVDEPFPRIDPPAPAAEAAE